MRFAWNRERPGVCSCLPVPPVGHYHRTFSALSISLLECVRVNEQLDISQTFHTLSAWRGLFCTGLLYVSDSFHQSPLGGAFPDFPSLGNAPVLGLVASLCYTVSYTSLVCPSPCAALTQLMAGNSFMRFFIHVAWLSALLLVGSMSE